MPFFPRSRSRRNARRREDDGVQTVAFELDSLEFVRASDALGLLRVGGHWTAPASRALEGVAVLVAWGTETLRLEPLPDLNGMAPLASPAGEEWRGAFTMTVDVVEDPRSEFLLVAGEDVRVDLPRPAEWADAQLAEDEAELEADIEYESDSPFVAELVARLDEVAELDEDDPRVSEPEQQVAEPAVDTEVAALRAELELARSQLQEALAELERERGSRGQLDEELRAHRSVEEDLRTAIASQEAELAFVVKQASQNARRAERRRDQAPAPAPGEQPRSHGADEDFLSRLERARRASEIAAA